MDTFIQDLKYGFRNLRRQPGFAAVAVLALAFGIGANTAIFSVINAVLLKPLPFQAPDRLVNLWTSHPQRGNLGSVSYPDFADWREQSQSFERMAAFRTDDFTLTGGDEPERLRGVVASYELFGLLGRQPELGRSFHPEEDQPGMRVVILSHELWQRRFNADREVIGRAISLNGHNYEIVGVMPYGFQFPIEAEHFDLWITMGYFATPPDGGQSMIAQRGNHFLEVIGRLKPGINPDQAQAEMATIASRLEQEHPDENAHRSVLLVSSYDQLVRDIRPSLLILFGAVGCVLLIACANVANLLMARASGRQRELAIRAALGAGRMRVIRQLLTESVLLAVIGGAIGLLLALWTTDLLIRIDRANIPRSAEISVDVPVLFFTMAMSLVTGIVFGLLPALQSSRCDLSESLKEGGRGSTEGAHRNRIRNTLVATEVAVAVVLLVGAALLIQSLWRLNRIDPGFEARGVLTAGISLPDTYSDSKIISFYEDLHDRLQSLPGARSAGVVAPLPMSGHNMGLGVDVEGRPTTPGERLSSDARIISPDYFRSLGIQQVAGRDFTQGDDAKSKPVVIVNEALASLLFPGEDPIGKRIRPTISTGDDDGLWREIIGVVGSIKTRRLTDQPRPELYIAESQIPMSSLTIVIKSDVNPSALIGALRAEVKSLDEDLPIYDVRTMDQYLGDSVSRQRFLTILLAVFAGVALLLTVVGLYGVLAYSVAQRTHEIGVRMALGARQRDVLQMVVSGGMKMTLIGVAFGLLGAYVLTRVLGSLLYEVGATDPATFAGIAVGMAIVALAACYLPARRATKVDPMVALRYE
jgi:putative ABC transport system permease protein